MRPTIRQSFYRLWWFAGVYLVIFSVGALCAQDTQPQEQIYLPPAIGGTPLSFQIEAEAKYVAAQGAFLESAAIARKINAEAVEQEIKNSVAYVKAYFDRREENRKRTLAERGGTILDHEATRQKTMELRINKFFRDTLKEDVTDEMNWLLQGLYVVQYMSRQDLDALDSQLTKEELDLVYLTDGGRGDKLVFPAGSGDMLKTPWPYAFQGSEFAKARKEFEDARDALVSELREKGYAGEESKKRLFKSIEQLPVDLEAAYPKERRKDTAASLQYIAATNYWKSLTAQVTRALATNDRSVFDGSLRFQGKTTVDLIQHMNKSGLLFYRPPAGGERVYSGLFTKMRNIYLALESEKNVGNRLPDNSGAN
jgi:hypothetical protein